ncbi:MAG: pyridoxal phosphate-dependent aminotransferase [Candidatus Zixiibacteriota bacterium]
MKLKRKDIGEIYPNTVDVPHRKTMLCLNEGPINPMKMLWKEISEKLERLEVNRYHTRNTGLLLSKLSEYAGIGKDSIAMGNGADELLYFFFVMLRSKSKDKIVFPAPSYFDYNTYSKAVGMSQWPIDLDENFIIDEKAMIEALQDDSSVAAIICNPNNPTGNLMPEAKIIDIIKSTEKPVLIDEAYFEFSKYTMTKLIDKYENLFILRTFSKGFLSAGLRFGYIMANPDSIYQLRKVMTAFNLSLVIQTIALVYLENIDWFRDKINELIRERALLGKALSQIEDIEPFDSATNFITFRIDGEKESLFEHIKDNDIAIRDVSEHTLLEDCLRVTIGTSSENQLFLEAINSYFE